MLLVPSLYLPARTFVIGHLGRPAQGDNIVRQVPQLLVLEDEVVRGHRGVVESSQDAAENVAWGRPALERSPGEVSRLHRQVARRGSVAPPLGPVAFRTFPLFIGLLPAGNRLGP